MVADENQIQYDFLCAIDGDLSLDDGFPFVVTYCITEDISSKNLQVNL